MFTGHALARGFTGGALGLPPLLLPPPAHFLLALSAQTKPRSIAAPLLAALPACHLPHVHSCNANLKRSYDGFKIALQGHLSSYHALHFGRLSMTTGGQENPWARGAATVAGSNAYFFTG